MKLDQARGPAIRVEHLTKEFPVLLRGVRLKAVDDLSLDVGEGQVFGLLGPNGSGKSTTIKILLGLLRATAGRCELFGIPSTEPRARLAVGYLPEAPDFYRFLSGRELVRFHARMCGMKGGTMEERIAEVIDWVGLSDAADRKVGAYSKGMLQRIGLAQALVHDPRLLILDEPTAGVDPVGTAEICALIGSMKSAGKTVLLSSHLLAQVESICDRIAILHRGRLLLEGEVSALVEDEGREALIVDALPETTKQALRGWLEAHGSRLLRAERLRSDLDRIFLEHVTGNTQNPEEKGPEAGQ